MNWKEKIESAVNLSENNSEMADFTGPASQKEIELAEQILAVRFPDSYKEFLTHLGSGNFSDAEFYSIVPGSVPASEIPCAIWFTLEERKDNILPMDFVVIYSSGFGPLYCLATSEASDGDCPIREWNYHEVVRDSSSLVSSSFADFLIERIQERVEIV